MKYDNDMKTYIWTVYDVLLILHMRFLQLQDIPRGELYPCLEGKKPENKVKNRYVTIFSCKWMCILQSFNPDIYIRKCIVWKNTLHMNKCHCGNYEIWNIHILQECFSTHRLLNCKYLNCSFFILNLATHLKRFIIITFEVWKSKLTSWMRVILLLVYLHSVL